MTGKLLIPHELTNLFCISAATYVVYVVCTKVQDLADDIVLTYNDLNMYIFIWDIYVYQYTNIVCRCGTPYFN